MDPSRWLQAQCNVTIAADLYFKQTRQTLARHSTSSVSPARYVCDSARLCQRLTPFVSWIEHCAQQGTNALGFRVMSLHASVPHCTILGANLMATLTGKKAKKQRAQRHVLQETQLNKAQTGQAALEHVNRDPSLTALLARVTAIQALMRRLKTAAYWSLVLDPQSFSSTVENMFAVAIIMDLALIQIVEDEDTGVAIVNWEFKEDDKEVDDEVLLGRIGDQGLNEEEVAQELEQAARTAMLFLMILRSLLVFI